MNEDTTHFGYREVKTSEKAGLVGNVFRQVAEQYDVMNDLMSLGTHRVMKRVAVELVRAKEGQTLLDIAGGTGDLTALLKKRVGPTGQVILLDINPEMVRVGRDRLLDQGHADTRFVIADAEKLPIQPGSVDGITMAFGLRNVTDKPAALAAMRQALKPGARLVVLEFSKVTSRAAQPAYAFFQSLWPKVGRWVTGDGSPYQYLVESIDMHPDQETLADMMRDAGLTHVGFNNLMGGAAAIHFGEAPLIQAEPASVSPSDLDPDRQ